MPHLSHAIISLDLPCFFVNKIEVIYVLTSLMSIKIMNGATKGNNFNNTSFYYISSGLDLFRKFHDQDFLSDVCLDSSFG